MGFTAIKAAESSGAAGDAVDFGGMSRKRKQLSGSTLEFIAASQDLRLVSGIEALLLLKKTFFHGKVAGVCGIWFVIMSVALRRC